MIGRQMAFIYDTFIQIRIFAHVIAYAEKGGLHARFFQYFQNLRCYLRNRAIVKSEVNLIYCRIYTPDGTGIK